VNTCFTKQTQNLCHLRNLWFHLFVKTKPNYSHLWSLCFGPFCQNKPNCRIFSRKSKVTQKTNPFCLYAPLRQKCKTKPNRQAPPVVPASEPESRFYKKTDDEITKQSQNFHPVSANPWRWPRKKGDEISGQ
jgi:hypothetical protein